MSEKENNKSKIVNGEIEVERRDDPYENLLTNLLIIAVRDLTHFKPHVRRSARAWFAEWENTAHLNEGFSFKDVVETLGIESVTVNRILAYAAKVSAEEN